MPLFDVYLKEYDKMFFFPDQHLGRNTARNSASRPNRWFCGIRLKNSAATRRRIARGEIDFMARALFGSRSL
jgi:quinolinate synthase